MKTYKMITIIAITLLLLNVFFGFLSSYQYKNNIGSYWSLSDKSSSIEKKSEYLDLYVKSLENAGLSGQHNALIFKTPDNLFDNNLIALKSLQQRMHEIIEMDVKSFEYQTAIQQITGQEQGEADEMIRLFKSIWYKEHYTFLWKWVGVTQILLLIIFLVFGIIFWNADY